MVKVRRTKLHYTIIEELITSHFFFTLVLIKFLSLKSFFRNNFKHVILIYHLIVRLKKSRERAQKITENKLFWYNDKTIPRVKSVLDTRSTLYQRPNVIKDTELSRIENIFKRGNYKLNLGIFSKSY